MDKVFWIAVEMDCFHPLHTIVRVIEDQAEAFLLGNQFLVYEKLPGIKEPKLIPWGVRRKEMED